MTNVARTSVVKADYLVTKDWYVCPSVTSAGILILIDRFQSHPVDQDIVCNDCKQKFTRAAGYVWHVESGNCKKNTHSHQQLEAQRQHKHILKKILDNPENFNFRIEPGSPGPELPEVAEEEDETETTGGVSLTSLAFDEDEQQKQIAYEPLRPDLGDLINFGSLTLHDRQPQWPKPGENARGPSAELSARKKKDPVTKAIEYNQNWESALANRDKSYKANNSANLMHSQNASIYNPESQSYDPYRFWDARLQAFRCPYAECE